MAASIPVGDDVDVRSSVEVAGDSEAEPAVVGEDGDSDAHASAEGDEGEVVEHLAARGIERDRRAGNVGDHRVHVSLRQPRREAYGTRGQGHRHDANECRECLAGLRFVRLLEAGHLCANGSEAFEWVIEVHW